MITRLSGFPDNTIAIAGSGHVTAHDYETELVPQVEQAFKIHRKLRLYYQIGPEFSGLEAGAAWDDFKLGVAHFGDWERVAVVTDIGWIRLATRAFAFLMPCDVRTFGLDEAPMAREWICTAAAATEPSSRPNPPSSSREAQLEEAEFGVLVREELRRRRGEVVSDTRHLIEKHLAILASETPEIRQPLANALILLEVRKALDQIEQEGAP